MSFFFFFNENNNPLRALEKGHLHVSLFLIWIPCLHGKEKIIWKMNSYHLSYRIPPGFMTPHLSRLGPSRDHLRSLHKAIQQERDSEVRVRGSYQQWVGRHQIQRDLVAQLMPCLSSELFIVFLAQEGRPITIRWTRRQHALQSRRCPKLQLYWLPREDSLRWGQGLLKKSLSHMSGSDINRRQVVSDLRLDT